MSNGYGNFGGGGQGGGYGGNANYGGDPYSGFETVNPEGAGGAKLAPGCSADIKIVRISPHRSQRDGGNGFLVEFEVAQASAQQDPPGSVRSWRQDMKNENVARPAVKAFMNALLCVSHSPEAQKWLDANGLSTQLVRYALSDANPFQGYYMHVDTKAKTTQRNFEFLQHIWAPFDYERNGLSVPDFKVVFESARAFVPQRPQAPPPMQQPQGYGPQQGAPSAYGLPMQQQPPTNYGPPAGGFAPQQQPPGYGPPQGQPGFAPLGQPQQQPPPGYGPPQGQPMQPPGAPPGQPQQQQGGFAPPPGQGQGPQGGWGRR